MNSPTATTEEICSQRSDIAAYVDGELSFGEELALDTHLAVCESCRRELNEQKELLRALDFALENEDEIEMPADFTRVVIANAESRVSGLRRPRERFQSLFVCAALFALAILGLGGETRAVFGTFAKFAEQFLAVGNFVWNLVYDIAFGTAIVLRCLSHQFVSNSAISVTLLLAAFCAALLVLSRFVPRLNRS